MPDTFSDVSEAYICDVVTASTKGDKAYILRSYLLGEAKVNAVEGGEMFNAFNDISESDISDFIAPMRETVSSHPLFTLTLRS